MKNMHRFIAIVCVIAVCLCGTPALASAATGSDDPLLPNAEVFPDPDQGGSGLPVEYLFNLVKVNPQRVLDFERSSNYYVGRSMLSGTNRFGFVITMYHSLAGTTTNYAMRGGVCYWDPADNEFKTDYPLYTVYQSSGSGTSRVVYIEANQFDQDKLYYVFLKNLIPGSDSSYVTGSVYFFREPTT